MPTTLPWRRPRLETSDRAVCQPFPGKRSEGNAGCDELPHLKRWLEKQPEYIRRRSAEKVEALAEDPRPPGAQKLRGREDVLYRIRVGDYRVIYAVEHNRLIVLIVAAGNRRDIYRGI